MPDIHFKMVPMAKIRIYGIPLPNAKVRTRPGQGVPFKRDMPLRLRNPHTGALIKTTDPLTDIVWPVGVIPRMVPDDKGVYLMHVNPRKYWNESIITQVYTWMYNNKVAPAPLGTPLNVNLGFLMPLPKKRTSIFPMTCDLDNLAYPIWNNLKGSDKRPHGICFHDDRQIVWATNTVRYASKEHPPGVLIQINIIKPMEGETCASTEIN